MDRLRTASDFLTHIATPDVQEFQAKPLDLRCAFHACISLLSLRDWVAEGHQGADWHLQGKKQTQLVGNESNRRGSLQTVLRSALKQVALVSDVANGAKHMKLSRDYTDMQGGANTVVQVCTTGGGYSSGSSRPMPKDLIVAEVGPDQVDVLQSVRDLHKLWLAIFAENRW